jgi:uncharacterized membrane protein HdeD (DUF308 family)
MLTHMARNWWVVALRGVFAIIFGILAFLWPGMTLAVLVLLFGAYALVDGVFAVLASLTHRAENPRWYVLLVEGVVGILMGVLTFTWPGLTALVLLYLIAAWAIVTGLLQIIGAIQLRKEIKNEWLLVLGGVLSVLFGAFIWILPGAGALTVIWLIATYSIIFGILFVSLGFRLRGLAGSARSGMAPAE